MVLRSAVSSVPRMKTTSPTGPSSSEYQAPMTPSSSARWRNTGTASRSFSSARLNSTMRCSSMPLGSMPVWFSAWWTFAGCALTVM